MNCGCLGTMKVTARKDIIRGFSICERLLDECLSRCPVETGEENVVGEPLGTFQPLTEFREDLYLAFFLREHALEWRCTGC